jgi:hypothetical protein
MSPDHIRALLIRFGRGILHVRRRRLVQRRLRCLVGILIALVVLGFLTPHHHDPSVIKDCATAGFTPPL